MPSWYYDKKELRNTPSFRDGINYKTEMRYREEGARLIINTGFTMGLGCKTVATGAAYYHRFYMVHSFKQFPRYVMACCCLFLAGKVEETPKKCKDIIKTARNDLTPQKFATFGEDPKEEVMILERILLQTIKFDFQVEHPYQYIAKYGNCLQGDQAEVNKMVQEAWTYVNDSLCTTLVLQWEPEIIAIALLYHTGRKNKFEIIDWRGRTSKHLRWWDMFVEDMTIDLIEDICRQVEAVYSQTDSSNTSDSPPLRTQKSNQQPPPVNTARTFNGHEKAMFPNQPPLVNTKIPFPSDIPSFPYQTFTRAPPPVASYVSTFSSSVSAPPGVLVPPCMSGPPPGPPPQTVFPYLSHPPPFISVVPPGEPAFFPTYAPSPSQPHRPFYPPPT